MTQLPVPAQYAIYPIIDATMNGISTILLLAGHNFIKRGRLAAHRAFMITALISSSIFLASYLYFHFHVGSVHFQGQGFSRPVYFAVLISHVVLAAAILPLIVITLTYALKQQFDKHQTIARWTYPLWLYVSITGVIVYFMLYHLFVSTPIFAKS